MGNITGILNLISASLLLPVIILLLAAVINSLISLGGFCTTCYTLLAEKKKRQELMNDIRQCKDVDFISNGSGFGERLAELERLNWDELECEKYISELFEKYDRELERQRFMIKIGPMLGLMGTLIPMGPALGGLASGDIGSMAYNMQVAFATTVLGCFIAGVAILILSVKKHAYSSEVANLRYVLDRKQKEKNA